MAAPSDKPDMTPGAFLASIFGASEGNVFVCALPNLRGDHAEFALATRDRTSIDGFVRKRDRAGSAIYFCVGALAKDAKPTGAGRSLRCKENVAEIVTLQADTDLKSVGLDRDGLITALLGLYMPPSIIVWSGRGAHAYWLLNEPVGADAETIARVEALNAQLADVVAGDAVQDACRLMRLPGSHNTKDGAYLPVEIVEARFEPRYALDDLEEWLAWQSPAIARKEEPRAPRTSLQTRRNVFERVADEHGFKIPLDADARLAAMSYQGAGETSIHNTQLAVTASLLTRGEAVEDVVELVLAATREAAGPDSRNWNWTREEKAILGMCLDWRRKHPEVVERARVEPAKSEAPRAQARQTGRGETVSGEADGLREASTGAVVHHLADERKKREKAPPKDKAKGKAAAPVVVADGVIAAIRERGGDIVLTEGETWIYETGVWTMATPADEQWLRTLIQTGCDEIGYAGDTKVANAAWKRLTEHPALHRRAVSWDAGSIVATTTGLLDLRTRVVGPYRPDAWCRSKIGQRYDDAATCPTWLRFLDGCFSNVEAVERGKMIGALQEAFGSFLAIRILNREQRKALFLLGPSRTGKTQVSIVARGLIGEPIAAPSIADIGEGFGMQQIQRARAWIRDDAVSEGDKVDPARFKAIVTGEGMEINRKRVDAIGSFGFNIPILLTANAMPRAQDSSDAIYNRALVIEMTRVVEEEDSSESRVALGLPADCVVGEALIALEGPGILNWSLDGLDRLVARGRHDPPATVRDAVKRFKADNNPVAAWLAVAVERSPGRMVERNDLRCSFNGWQREEQGDEAKAWGGRALFPKIRTSAPWADVEGYTNERGQRFVTGIALADSGLRFWEDHHSEALRNGTKGSSDRASEVNRAFWGDDTAREGPKTEF